MQIFKYFKEKESMIDDRIACDLRKKLPKSFRFENHKTSWKINESSWI